MDKNSIKKFAVQARIDLLERVSQKALKYGVEKDGKADASADSVNGFVLTDEEKKQRKALINAVNSEGYEEVMEEVAYTWFNRFIALRFMEVNNYLPSRVRVFTDESNNLNPQILTEAIHLDMPGLDMEKVFAFKVANQTEELYQYLLMTQCYALHDILPIMFPQYHCNDYTMLLMPGHLLREGSVIDKMLKDTDEKDWQDAVQIIGWMYQYYISEKHDAIINIYKGTVSQKDVPAATQLFTTDWVVKYMVDNSVGRYWIERNPNSNLVDKLEFFVKPKDGIIHYVDETITPQDVTFFDPCMGSGHILAYAFDVLMEIYREYGYTDREAVSEILRHNLHGFDIDKRCTQLAYFVVMMKARQYDAGFFKRDIHPQVYFPEVDRELKDYGSILQIAELGEKPKEPEELTFFNANYDVLMDDWNCRRLLTQKYAVVCTNPPYLNKYNNVLKDFVLDNYKDYSGDLFSVFMYRNFDLCKPNGYSAFMTPFVWMFIKTYEKLREFIIQNKAITTLVQMEYSAFEEATVPICSFVLRNGKPKDAALCFRLSDFKGGMEVQRQKVLEALQNPECGYFYEADQSNFSKIPGVPVAYWISDKLIDAYSKDSLSNYAVITNGLFTCDNKRFLRLWHEVDREKTAFSCSSKQECLEGNEKWYPYNKGGEFRRWYGNHEYVVNFKSFGREISEYRVKSGQSASFPGQNYYFKESISWSLVSSSKFGIRYYPAGFVFDIAGSSIFPDNIRNSNYILAFLASEVAFSCLKLTNPTINFQAGNIKSLPLQIVHNERVDTLVEQNIDISRKDWNSFETSWDFQAHPLIKNASFSRDEMKSDLQKHIVDMNKLEEAYINYKDVAYRRFMQLKANEEELNRIFIDIYGLQAELTPEVEDKDVTVYRYFDEKEDIPESMGSSKYALTKRDMMVSFISYAVGCMLGRYSLDVEGLAYAGGEWDASKYRTFHADEDNIIPICDDEYFDDDIVSRFIKFVEIVFGTETLQENLKFIADALGGKGQPKEVIRNYFLNDFFKDHCKTYQKRPIYWLFDSGKKNGFKALIYMHRYQPDTIARIRTDYVHEQQSRYRTAIADMEARIASASTGERVKLNKALTKLQDQATEIRAYEEKIHHLADQMISIDLDDGVKHNYEIFKDVLAKIK